MQTSVHDQILFDFIKERMAEGSFADRKKNYVKQTKLLWSGQHYLLVRTGPKSDGDEVIRKVVLWSREYLLLKRKDQSDNAMMTIALAALDPVHHVWRSNRSRVLHVTGRLSGHERFRGKKLTKSVLADMIAFCEDEDRTFFEREAAESNRVNEANKFAQDAVRLVQSAGFKIVGAVEENGVPRPAGARYGATTDGSTESCFDFKPNSSVDVNVDISDLEVDSTEFEILVEALGKIQKLKRARLALISSTTDKEEVETA
jgi:hypothetical protein